MPIWFWWALAISSLALCAVADSKYPRIGAALYLLGLVGTVGVVVGR